MSKLKTFLNEAKILEFLDQGFSVEDIYNIAYSSLKLIAKGKKEDLREIQVILGEHLLEKSFVDPQIVIDNKNIDKEKFTPSKYEVKTWQTGNKEWRNSVNVSYAQKSEESNLLQLQESILENLKDNSPKVAKKTRAKKSRKENLMYMPALSDAHFGKASITTDSFQDLEDRFNQSVEELCERVSGEKIEKILFPFGNDFFNFDSKFKTTTQGTPQDATLGWADLFNECKRILIRTIDYMSEIAPVEIISIPGNHDHHSTISMSHVLDAWFHNDKNITTDTVVADRKYKTWGNSLLGFCHGDQEKTGSLPNLMATEARKQWSDSLYKVFFMGHLHKKAETRYRNADEECGVRVKVLPSLSTTDAWHASKGYIGNLKSAEGYLFSSKEGLKTTHEINFL